MNSIFASLTLATFYFIDFSSENINLTTIINRNLKKRLDASMERIEDGISTYNKDIICHESNYSIKLIKKNLVQLKKVEPYYDWQEIEEILKINRNKYCKN